MMDRVYPPSRPGRAPSLAGWTAACALILGPLGFALPAVAGELGDTAAPVCAAEVAPALAEVVESSPVASEPLAALAPLAVVHPAVDPRAGIATESDAFVLSSSRAVKEGFSAIDSTEVLARVVGLPLTTWTYKTDEGQIRHLGPMAEDFFAAFSLGRDEKGISLIDTGGVALAAIQGLYRKLEEKEAEVQALRRDSETRIEALSRQNDDLAARLAALEQQLQSLAATPRSPKPVEVAPAVPVPDPPLG